MAKSQKVYTTSVDEKQKEKFRNEFKKKDREMPFKLMLFPTPTSNASVYYYSGRDEAIESFEQSTGRALLTFFGGNGVLKFIKYKYR